MQPTIRQIVEADIPSFRAAVDVVARERRYLYLTEAPPLDQVQAFARGNVAKGVPHLVLETGQGIAGWCTIMAPARAVQAHVGGVAMGLLPARRDQGWGTKLMQAALAAADVYGFTRLELSVYANNPRAHGLYSKLGFVEEGVKRRSVRIGDDYLDEILMARLRD